MTRQDVHEVMDILSAICTIIVSVIAIWGSLTVWSSGVWHKLTHVIEHYHQQIVSEERLNIRP